MQKGEGFWVTVVFLAVYLAVVGMAAYTKDPTVIKVAEGFTTIIGMIATNWFATRGKTSTNAGQS